MTVTPTKCTILMQYRLETTQTFTTERVYTTENNRHEISVRKLKSKTK